MSLTAAQRRYLERLDTDEVAEFLGLYTPNLDEATRLREQVADMREAIEQAHEDHHAPGPVEWCTELPCSRTVWDDLDS